MKTPAEQWSFAQAAGREIREAVEALRELRPGAVEIRLGSDAYLALAVAIPEGHESTTAPSMIDFEGERFHGVPFRVDDSLPPEAVRVVYSLEVGFPEPEPYTVADALRILGGSIIEPPSRECILRLVDEEGEPQ